VIPSGVIICPGYRTAVKGQLLALHETIIRRLTAWVQLAGGGTVAEE
jgi:hypothetical protein